MKLQNYVGVDAEFERLYYKEKDAENVWIVNGEIKVNLGSLLQLEKD